MSNGQVHRPGGLKQTNKSHKTGRHRSKGAINAAVQGKTNVKTITKRARKELGKEARRHQNQQIRAKKRDEVLAKKRNLGGSSAPPILISVVPLQEDFDVQSVIALLTESDKNAEVSHSSQGVTHISVPRFKQRFSLFVPPIGNTFATLDAIKVSTTVLFLSSVTNQFDKSANTQIIDSWGEEILESSIAQGLPRSIIGITDLDSIPIKKRQEVKQQTQDLFTKWLPDEKIVPLGTEADALNLFRKAGSQKQRNIVFTSKRPHLLAENIKYTSGESVDGGILEVSGYLRGMPLSVNGLVHIPGLGDFQMSQIDAPEDPYPLDKCRSTGDVKMTDLNEKRILQVADPSKQESLDKENIVDPMDAEQTWPTEEELAEVSGKIKRKAIVKLVPKGTSEYQAAWIPDEDGKQISDDELENSEEESDDEKMSVGDLKITETDDEEDENIDDEQNDDEYEISTIPETAPEDPLYDEQMDMYEEREAMTKIKSAKLDAQFPDEVDTPQDQLAKVRFQKYRGLESFRTSPWDPKENLPFDYSRIFQFANFERTRRRIFKEIEDNSGDEITPGWFITIHVKGVKQESFNAFCTLPGRPLIIFGLLPNEQKMSLLNLTLKRTNSNDEPIKSKERLIFQCGFRRFSTCPVFSQHTNSSKHKYVRYLQNDDTVVASMYAPITFPPCQVLCYKEKKDGRLEFIARGSVLSADPNRLIIKRVVLSGHPFKVNKRSAVIRFMFFFRDDILWFKPVQLRTKYGRRGHIKEPLGTHGHMKCVFDGQLKSQDTILMNMYKRVFPKWTYEPFDLTSEICESTIDD